MTRLMMLKGPASPGITGDEIAVSIGVDARFIQNADTVSSVLLEKFTDGLTAAERKHYIGMVPNSITLSLDPLTTVKMAVAWMGKQGYYGFGAVHTASAGDGSPTADNATPDMIASAHIGVLREGAAISTEDIRNIEITFGPQLRDRPVLGSFNSLTYGRGQFSVRGTLTQYYKTGLTLQKFIDQTATDLQIPIEDGSGNFIGITIPKMVFDDGDQPNPGRNQDGMVTLPFLAYKDATSGVTIQIDMPPQAA